MSLCGLKAVLQWNPGWAIDDFDAALLMVRGLYMWRRESPGLGSPGAKHSGKVSRTCKWACTVGFQLAELDAAAPKWKHRGYCSRNQGAAYSFAVIAPPLPLSEMEGVCVVSILVLVSDFSRDPHSGLFSIFWKENTEVPLLVMLWACSSFFFSCLTEWQNGGILASCWQL